MNKVLDRLHQCWLALTGKLHMENLKGARAITVHTLNELDRQLLKQEPPE